MKHRLQYVYREFTSLRFRSLAFAIAVALPPGIQAQAITVIGGNSLARDCYLSASLSSTQQRLADRRALDTCTFALQHGTLNPRDTAATLVNRGIVNAALDNFEDALNDYEDALVLKPEFGEIYVNRGNIYFLGRAYGRAIEDYSKAIELKIGQLHVAHLNRGMAYEKIGDRVHAEADYRQALTLSPDWMLAQEKLDQMTEAAKATGADT